MIKIIFIFQVILNAQLFIKENKDLSIPEPTYSIIENQNKWWSNDFFGNVHKKIAKKAFELIPEKEYPDLFFYKKDIIEGSSDEEGHPNPKHNGGNTYSIWHSTKPIYDQSGPELAKDGAILKRIIGVLYQWENLNFKEAYENIGVMVHLTQDQATPVHAANIKHFYFDQFERFYEDDHEIDMSDSQNFFPKNLKPWEYYQYTQDDTRKNLKKWIDPETKIPYWEEAKNAPPPGKDSTYGPHGSYGGGKDHFAKTICEENYDNSTSCKLAPKSPEIRKRQIQVAVYATSELLKSASKNLPPLITDIKANNGKVFINVIENRCKKIDYEIIKNGEIIKSNSIYLDTTSSPFKTTITETLKSSKYQILIKDCDGNTDLSEFEI